LTPIGGYQRLRLPAGIREVHNRSTLFASCVDGGSPEHRHRPPPPPNHPIRYASDCIRLKRVIPVPSPTLTLAEANRAGTFSLVGTGSQDHVQVLCPPNETWLLTVDGPLGLISLQDDIAGAANLYGKPAILDQLQYLDQIENLLRLYTPSRCLLLSLFACLRREISWLLPTAGDPAAVTRDHLRRFCRMLFQDPKAHAHLHWFEECLKPVDELAPVILLESAIPNVAHPPSQESLRDLARALANGQPEEPYCRECVRSVVRQFSTAPSEEDLRPTIAPLAQTTSNIKKVLAQRRLTPRQQAGILNTLYRFAQCSIPADARFLNILAHSFQLDEDRFDAFPPARCL
jgi:transcriptional regulator with XRE-family HTH domain